MDSTSNLQYLLQGHIAGSLSDQEKLTLFQLLENKENLHRWSRLIEDLYEKAVNNAPGYVGETTGYASNTTGYQDSDLEEMIRYILHYPAREAPATADIVLTPDNPEPAAPRGIARAWWYAAAAIVLLSIATYFWTVNKPAGTGSRELAVKNDITAPSGTKAILTLANGSTIILDSMQNGLLAEQGSASVQKVDNGQLAYNATTGKPAGVFYNTLSTAKGGRTRVVLADGTKVWLNALSSMKFPTAFTGSDRTIELTGEAYFEVAPNHNKPFKIKKGTTEITVLGTHFNVNAYDDEENLTLTLLEGKVSISSASGQQPKVIQPGEQTTCSPDGKLQTTRNADLDKAIAWVNNEFDFEKDDIAFIMRQLTRWYDVDVKYAGISGSHYTGHITRTASISQVLDMFGKLGYVRFEIAGRTISIIPTGKKPG